MSPIGVRLRGWKSWSPSDAPEKNTAMPTLLRRRITPVGQQALNCAWDLPDAANARLILSSRHGEVSRTLSLLEAATNGGDVSPADFTLSVHHALIGLLSIAQGNCKGHTAIAAGPESFCFGLLEAAACLRENPDEPVVLMHFDDLLSGSFAEFNEPNEQPIALALSLTAMGEGDVLQIAMKPIAAHEETMPSHVHNFLEFLQDGAREKISVGANREWRWSRDAAA